MAYRTLLVHLPQEKDMDDLLGVAAALAERHAAHLTGLHVMPRIDLPFTYEVPAVVYRQFESDRLTLSKTLGERFETAAGARDIVAEWRVFDGAETSVERALTELGNTSDLIIAGQAYDSRQRSSRSELTARLLGGAGRPVMLVPPERRGGAVGERVFIAWDGQRAATRALFAALPLLARAGSVRLQRINAPDRDRHHALGTTELLAGTLARHGVEVEVFHSDAREAEVGADLLGFAEDWGADLIVSGCQEQGVLREFLLGSSTRHLLEHSRLPMLMSS